ncbi:MAG: hypothetical protein ACJ77A_07165 [Actinomycetota bacterium]
MIHSLIADAAPARGYPPEQVIPATAVFIVIVGVVAFLAVRYRQGRAPRLRAAVERVERRSGMPAWASIGPILTLGSLVVAAFGFYWDVSVHIGKGRDSGPFGTPAHFPIVFGLLGMALAGVIAVVIGADGRSRTSVRLTRNWNAPVGGVLLAICGLIAFAGFPLDDVWHTLFGQDVTLWSPTHIQMIGGASLATLAAWVLLEEGRRASTGRRLGWLLRNANLLLGGAFLLGLSTLQAEFDFGVPQFRQVLQPTMIMLAAGIGLVAIRLRGGRGSALTSTLVFLGFRALLAVLVGPVLGRPTPHFPLYLPEALLVEAVAWRIPRTRELTVGAVSGVLIGTVGLAAEWAWSHVYMPLPWHASLLPEAAVFGLVAAVAGGVLGALAGRGLMPPETERQRAPRGVAALGWLAALAVIAVPLPMTAHTGYRATVKLANAPAAGPNREVTATVRLDPPTAAREANWFDVTDWQGGTGTWGGGVEGLVISQLRQVSPGVYRTEQPFPVGGNWKALIRLHTGDSIQAVPVFLPRDPEIPAKEVPAKATFTRSFVPDKQILQREATGGAPWLMDLAYAACGLIAFLWLASMAWGLRRMDSVGPPPRLVPARWQRAPTSRTRRRVG